MTVHRATAGFWKRYDALPADIRAVADRNFDLLKRNPRHPSLHFKKIGRAWSVRIGRDFRAMALPSANGFDWFWIGNHADYEKLIG